MVPHASERGDPAGAGRLDCPSHATKMVWQAAGAPRRPGCPRNLVGGDSNRDGNANRGGVRGDGLVRGQRGRGRAVADD